LLRVNLKGQISSYQFEENHSERKKIIFESRGKWRVSIALRRAVRNCESSLPVERWNFRVICLSEIEYFDTKIASHHDVLGLKVEMDNIMKL